MSTDVGQVKLISAEQLEHICETGGFDNLGKKILREHFDMLTNPEIVKKREGQSVFFSGLGEGMFKNLVKQSDTAELTEDLKDFNATVGVIVALIISFAYAFNLGDVEPDERNLFALCGEDQFQENRLSIGKIIIGVLNFLVIVVSIAVLVFTCRAYFFLCLLPVKITPVFVELVGARLFLDLTQILLGVAFWLLYLIIAFYALVIFPYWIAIPLVVIQLIGISLHSACVINIDQKFFTTMLLAGAMHDNSLLNTNQPGMVTRAEPESGSSSVVPSGDIEPTGDDNNDKL